MRGFFQKTIFGPSYRWWALGIVGLANFVATMDLGIINISLPVIITEFNADMALAGWIALIYALVTATLYLPFGRLSDLVGRKRVLSAGFLLYSLGSAVAGSSRNSGHLVLFRGIQSVGSCLMTSNTFALITALFPVNERGRAMGISGGTISAFGFTIGPVLGGFLAYTLGWRSIFYVGSLFGVIGFVASQLILREEGVPLPHKKVTESFDFSGAVLFSLGLGTFMLALTTLQKGPWDSPLVKAEFLIAILSLLSFFWWESRTPYPLLDLKLFRIRLFAAGNVARLMCFTATTVNGLLMPFLLQLGLGMSPLRAGTLMTPNALGLAVVSPISGWLSERISARFLSSLGLAVMAVAFLMLSSLSPGASSSDIVMGLVLLGVGLGLFQAPNNNSVMSSVPVNRLGVASSFIAIVRSLGQSIGAALATTTINASLFAVAGQISLQGLQNAGLKKSPVLLLAFVQGYRYAHVIAGMLCVVGLLASAMRGPYRSP
jgi:EmrB/QacA subfamily drug resistance transporter